MRRRLVLVAVLALISSATVAADLPAAAGQASPPPLTPKQARRILEDYERVNARNNDTLDIERQATVETAPIQAIDDANFREFQGRGETSLGERTKIDQR